MTLNNEIEISDLLKAVDEADGDVWLISVQGDKYNLKSVFFSLCCFWSNDC